MAEDRKVLESRKDLAAALVELLRTAPAGLAIARVYDHFESSYRFPTEWMREMPTGDGVQQIRAAGRRWQDMAPAEVRAYGGTEPQWRNELRFARQALVDDGRLDGSTRGVWKLRPSGTAPPPRPAAVAPTPVPPQPPPVARSAAAPAWTGQSIVDHVHACLAAEGLEFSRTQVADFYLSVRTKPFVLLAGISGTGKSNGRGPGAPLGGRPRAMRS